MSANTTTILVKRSFANNTPTPLKEGELAYSFASNNLFIGNASNSAVLIGGANIVARVVTIESGVYVAPAYNQANTAQATAVSAYNQANTALGVASGASAAASAATVDAALAANTTQVYANNTLKVSNAALNFNNTSTIRVDVVSNGTGRANISFDYIGATDGIASFPTKATGGTVVSANGLNFVNSATVGITVTQGTTGNANISFTTLTGGGTITQLDTGLGLTGGPITNSGTIRANVANTTVQGITKLIDVVNSTDSANAATANSVKVTFDQATSAYGQANTANTTAVLAYGQANAAYAQANTANATAALAYGQANLAYAQANTANSIAISAYGQANLALTAANNAANTVRVTANSGSAQSAASLNFINTASILVSIGAGSAGNANVGFNAVSGTTAVAGILQLTDSITSTSTTTAATPNSVKSAFDQGTLAYGQANSGYTQANSAYGQANAAYSQANTANSIAISAYGQANLAYTQANTANSIAISAYGQANAANATAVSAYGQANSAYAQANTANTIAVLAYGQANAAYTRANTANSIAILAYGQANASFSAANNAANTVRVTANSGSAQSAASLNFINTASVLVSVGAGSTGNANIAFSAVSGSTTVAGILQLTDSVTSTSTTTAATPNSVKAAFDQGTAAYAQANGGYAQANSAYTQANAAYTQANSANSIAISAYGQANLAYTQANTANSIAISAYGQANLAYTQANTANSIAISAYGQANAAFTAANNAANTVRVTANSLFAQSAVSLNFVNTSTVTVSISPGAAGIANIAFTSTATGGGGSGTLNNFPVSVNTGSTVSANGLNFINSATVTVTVTPGINGNANISFASVTGGTGTVTSVGTGLGLTGGPISSSGTISANVANTTVQGITKLIDVVTSTDSANAATANSVKVTFDQATLAYGQANTANSIAISAYGQANLAYAQANTANSIAISAYGQANAAFTAANNAANTVRVTANSLFAQSAVGLNFINTASVTVSVGAGTSGNANVSFSAVAGTTAVAGILQLTDSVTSTSTTTAATPNSVKSTFDQATLAYGQANTANTTAVSAYGQANAAFAAANSAANGVKVSANSGSIFSNVSLNFVNTATVQVSVTNPVAGIANIAFTSLVTGGGTGTLNNFPVSVNTGSTVSANGLNFLNSSSILVSVSDGTTGNANITLNATNIADTVRILSNGVSGVTKTQNVAITSTGRVTEWSHLENGNFYTNVYEGTPAGIFAGNNGSSIYIAGSSSDNVIQYNLSTAWNVATASLAANLIIGAQESIAVDLFFKSDGTRLYVLGDSGNDISYWTLSTPWNLGGTITFDSQYSVSAQTSAPRGLHISDNGTKMWVSSATQVFQYTIATPWDLTTATYDSKSYTQVEDTAGASVTLNPAGTIMLIAGSNNDYIYEYQLSTANDVSTAAYTGRKKGTLRRGGTSESETGVTGIYVAYPNNRMYLTGSGVDSLIEYTLDKGLTIVADTLSVEGAGHFSDSLFVGGDIRVASSVDVDSSLRVTGASDFNGIFTHGSGTGNYGGSGSTSTYRVGYGATTSGSTKSVEIGTNGLAGSNTNIIIGPAGAASNININANTVTISNTVNIGNRLVVSGLNVLNEIGLAKNTVSVTANSGPAFSNVSLNFVNTSTIFVSVGPGTTGNANVTFSVIPSFTTQVNTTSSLNIAGTGTFGNGLTINNNQPALTINASGTISVLEIRNTTGTADNNRWQLKTVDSSGRLRLQALTDAGAGGGSVLDVTRQAQQITGVILNTVSSNDALRITQTGTGNAFVVEDEANPDGTPFVITSTGSVGIGTTTPTTTLDVVGSANVSASLNVGGYNILNEIFAADNTVRVTANSGSAQSAVSLNFINTASVLVSVGAGAAGIANIAFTSPKTINFIIDGGGSILTTGNTAEAQTKGYVSTSFNATITEWNIFPDVSSTLRVDVFKATYANFPTMTLISGTNPPRLTAETKNTGTTTGWTSNTITAGDILEFRINATPAIVSASRVTVVLALG